MPRWKIEIEMEAPAEWFGLDVQAASLAGAAQTMVDSCSVVVGECTVQRFSFGRADA